MTFYFDNAATTPLLPEVKEAMKAIIDNDFGNPSSIHMLGRKSKTQVERARKVVANTLNSSIGEIFFTSGATEANNMVIQRCVTDLGVKRIISSPLEHHCIIHTLDYVKANNCEVVYLTIDAKGKIDLQELQSLLAEKTIPTLVTLMHGNNEIGNINPIESISTICLEHKAYFHTDAAQTLGKLPIDVQATKIDFLSASAHKFHGPKGVGILYINGDNKLTPLLFGGSQERNMRSGTENVIGIVGLARALELCNANRADWQAKILTIKSTMKAQMIDSVPGIQFLGDIDNSLHHVLSTSFPPSANSDLMEVNLDMAGIYASAGSACSSGTLKASHVMEALNVDPSRKTVRFSFSHLNTTEETHLAMTKIMAMR